MADKLVLMEAMAQKMAYLETRQKAIAQNVANADTPGARPVEVTAPDFKALLGSSTSALSLSHSSLATTNDKHMTLSGGSASGAHGKDKPQKTTYEVAPAGNAIVLEEQLLKMNENFTDHRFITNLYQKNVDMLERSVRSN